MAPTPWAARAASSPDRLVAAPAIGDDGGEGGGADDNEGQRPDAPMSDGDGNGGDRDRQGVGREDPGHADDGRVELAVQVGQGEGNDGGIGEREPHRADQQRDDDALPDRHGGHGRHEARLERRRGDPPLRRLRR